jgi:hypothetical protein
MFSAAFEASLIQPSDTLPIQKNIFEPFLNGTPWNSFLVAEIAQYPAIPEPQAALLVAMFCALNVKRRAKSAPFSSASEFCTHQIRLRCAKCRAGRDLKLRVQRGDPVGRAKLNLLHV